MIDSPETVLANRKQELEDQLTPNQHRACLCLFAGMSYNAAARNSGMNSAALIKKMLAEVEAAREYLYLLRAEARKAAEINLEVVTKGFRDAIAQARQNDDANTQINGWREIAKLYGLYAPEKKTIELSAPQQQVAKDIAMMSESDLLELAGQDGVLEGEFELLEYEPKKAG